MRGSHEYAIRNISDHVPSDFGSWPTVPSNFVSILSSHTNREVQKSSKLKRNELMKGGQSLRELRITSAYLKRIYFCSYRFWVIRLSDLIKYIPICLHLNYFYWLTILTLRQDVCPVPQWEWAIRIDIFIANSLYTLNREKKTSSQIKFAAYIFKTSRKEMAIKSVAWPKPIAWATNYKYYKS